MPLFLADASGYDAQRSDQGHANASINALSYPDYQEPRALPKESRLSTPESDKLDVAGPHYPEILAVRSIAINAHIKTIKKRLIDAA